MEMKIPFQKVLAAGLVLLVAIVILNSFFVFSLGKSLNVKLAEAKELAMPAKIEIIKLESSCTGCFDADAVIGALKNSGIEVSAEKSLPRNSQETLDLIKKYNIGKLPAIVLKGEIDKDTIPGFKKVEDALVFDAITPPYEDTATKKAIGKVSAIIIKDSGCKVCMDLNLMVQNLKQNGVSIDKEKTLDSSGSEAKGLIGKHNITKVPVLLLSSDVGAYEGLAQSIGNMKSKDGSYYIIESQAPYIEAESGKLRGLAKLTLLNDSSCKECYNVDVHKSILARFGVSVEEEKTVDAGSAEGKRLISKYSIKSVPTILLTGDLKVYGAFNSVWKQVGKVEADGAYIFTEISAMGPGISYKDTLTNEVKKVEAPQQESAQQ